MCACAHVLCGILTVYSIEEFGWRVRITGVPGSEEKAIPRHHATVKISGA